MLLSRENYRKVKNMNRVELEQYLNTLYKDTDAYGKGYKSGYNAGYNKGVEDTSVTVLSRIQTAILNTKGIGEKRCIDIMNSLAEELQKAEN